MRRRGAARTLQAQVDWYEAVVELAGEQLKLQFFSLRGMWSGAAFHQAYLRATQQAFLAAFGALSPIVVPAHESPP